MIGAVLVPGGRAPVVVTEAVVRTMKHGAVIVDCAVDQGGCVETIHETSHADPVYELHGVLHYAVGNIPGAVPHTSTYALTNATLPYALALATHGVAAAVQADPELGARASTRSAGASPTRPWPRRSTGRRRANARRHARDLNPERRVRILLVGCGAVGESIASIASAPVVLRRARHRRPRPRSGR